MLAAGCTSRSKGSAESGSSSDRTGNGSSKATTGTAKVWIGAADGLPHQSDSEYKVANYGGKSHLVYEYNINVKVEPPR